MLYNNAIQSVFLVIMRIPLSWLKEYISLDQSPSEIAKMLTMIGLEVDHFETFGENLKNVVVGSILETSKHPQADKLTIATVSDGEQSYQVVCGAPNCRKGIKTAFARIGVTLGHGEESYTIKKAKLRGIESSGMLCSGQELGLSDDADGILELSQDLPDGLSLSKIFSDTFFDISLTPNLSHCSSVMGVARELAALTEQSLRLPEYSFKESKESIEDNLYIDVIDKEACPRYACRVIKNVEIGPSPNWLKKKIEKCGLRSINNVVDVTNYILLETGHPLHAFDWDKVEGRNIIVRKARENEVILTLDGKQRQIKDSMLAICDSAKPLAIAGVMGGENSEIHEQTKNIILECAYFDPLSIRRTSKQLNLQTDASKRFERGTDPNSLSFVLDRATALIQQVAGGEILSGCIDARAREFPESIVTCRLSRINKVIGVNFSRGEVENILKRLQFIYVWDGKEQFTVHVPTYRVDINSEIDLIEEVARFYGYDNIPRQGSYYQASRLPSTPMYVFEKKVRGKLISEGLQEFLTCDLIGPTLLNIVQDENQSADSLVKVLNPTSVEQSILRTSLLPGLLEVVKYNIDHMNSNIAGFEIGRIHFLDGNQFKEQTVAGIILTGHSSPDYWDRPAVSYDFYDLKGIVENFLKELGLTNLNFKNLKLGTFHSGRQASIFIDSLEIGSIGEIHPAIQRRLDVPQRILFGEFNLQDLLPLTKPLDKMKPLSIYPKSDRDWTFTIKKSVPYEVIHRLLVNFHSPILENVSLKAIYQSEKIGLDYQNMTLHFVFRDLSKTIEQQAVDAEMKRLSTAVLQQLSDAIKI